MSSYLDELEAQLRKLTERQAHQPLARPGAAGRMTRVNRTLRHRHASPEPEPPRRAGRFVEVLAFAAVLAVTAGVVAVILAAGQSGTSRPAASSSTTARHTPRRGAHHSTARTHHASGRVPAANAGPSGGPVPTGFVPSSFTAIDELHWWLLGTAPCGAPPCTSIVRTRDGGGTFAGLPAPRTRRVTQLRFGNSLDGFAFGPDLFATHDGGATWQPVNLGGTVSDLAISGGAVYAEVSSVGAAPAGVTHLVRSPLGGGSWTTLAAAGDVALGLWVHGRDVFVQSGSGSGYGTAVLISHDGGASFTRRPLPNGGGLPCSFVEQQAPVLWAHCATGMLSGVWRSTDDGTTFTPVSPQSGQRTLSNHATFAAATSNTAVAGDQGPLSRTTDGGATWTSVGPSGLAWFYLGFTDATHGVALAAPATDQRAIGLLYTTDAGASYHPVSIR